jgi:hypothetical protein
MEIKRHDGKAVVQDPLGADSLSTFPLVCLDSQAAAFYTKELDVLSRLSAAAPS